MPDPKTIETFLVAVVGGSSGRLAEMATGQIATWIRSIFKGAPKEALDKAESNTTNFISELDQRLKVLEQNQKVGLLFDNIKSDIDFFAVFQDTLKSAAKTYQPEKHRLLSDLILLRMISGSESTQALALNKALETVPHLTVSQIKLLGLYAAYSFASSLDASEPEPIKTIREIFFPYKDLVNNDESYEHLFALSCLSMISMAWGNGTKIPQQHIVERFFPADYQKMKENDVEIQEQCNSHEESKWLFQLFDQAGFRLANLTTIGKIIGKAAHNSISIQSIRVF